ncbi:hypothetical protein K439DRAFT_1347551 [Ramaria rubella]|nr:hypothetical protein K439DRAFT_1347551 [Ramaria rubella]
MSVAGPYAARHPSPIRRSKVVRQSSSYQPPPPTDPYYGHTDTAHLCQRFIQALFACPNRPPPSTTSPSSPTPTLAVFVAYSLHRTRLHPSVTFTALFLLSRLKSRFPAARGSSGHRLFISAFMIASKVVCDDTYSNKSWTVVGQGMFSLREINQMEREMCGYLEWVLNVDPKELREFEAKVRKDYGPDGSCPAFVHPPQPASTPGSTPVPPSSDAVGASHNQLQNTMSSISVPEPPHLVTPPESPHRRSTLPRAPSISQQGPPPPPTHVLIPTPIDARPSTPQLGSREDDSPSPASSTTCLTPQSDDEADDATIVSTGMHSELSSEIGGPTRTNSALSMVSAASLPPKSKWGRDPSFAFPSRTVW